MFPSSTTPLVPLINSILADEEAVIDLIKVRLPVGIEAGTAEMLDSALFETDISAIIILPL